MSAQFPSQVWNGLSSSRARNDEVQDPDKYDFAQIRDELQAVQEVLLGETSTADLQAAIDAAAAGAVVPVSGSHASITLPIGVSLLGGPGASIDALVVDYSGAAGELESVVEAITIGDVTANASAISDDDAVTTLVLRGCRGTSSSDLAFTGRAVLYQDTFKVEDSGRALHVVCTNGNLELTDSRVGIVQLAGDCFCTDKDTKHSDSVFVGGQSSFAATGCDLGTVGSTDGNATDQVSIVGGSVSGTLSAGALTTINAKSTNILQGASVGGTGKVTPAWKAGQVTTSGGAGDKDVTFDLPMGTGETNYQVFLSEVGATPAGILPSVKTKAADKFVLRDTVGGRTFDWMIRFA